MDWYVTMWQERGRYCFRIERGMHREVYAFGEREVEDTRESAMGYVFDLWAAIAKSYKAA